MNTTQHKIQIHWQQEIVFKDQEKKIINYVSQCTLLAFEKKYNTYYVLKNTHDAKEMLLMRLPLNYLLVLE